jgi:hypothetical protein
MQDIPKFEVINLRFMKSIFLLICLLSVLRTGWSQSQWPRDIETPQAKITMYQPQPESFYGDKLTGRAAVAITPASETPIFGAVWLTTRVATDRTARTVTLVDARVISVKFPQTLDSATLMKFKILLETEIVKWDLEISLDDLLATLELNEQEKDLNDNFKTEAPEIIISAKPAVLVIIDGEPKMVKIEGSSLQRVVNAPYYIVKNTDGKYYLNSDKAWYSAGAITGDWAAISNPPKEVKKQHDKIAKDEPETAADAFATKSLIIVRTAPAELIVTEGDAAFTPIQGTQLLFVKNTGSHVFMSIDSQDYFILISGRWYSSESLKGPWTFVAADKLPSDFAKIPEGSEKDVVLASVAGTPASKEALLDAQVPQTAAVDRKSATVTVKYDGDPKFEKIEGTTLAYAVNTQSKVILADKTYFVCDKAVWFTASQPNGPWTVATEVPKDVQKIPPTSPVYNVKYVYIYDSTPDVVYVGYTPGYVGCYAYGPTVVYGTGYYYNPWYGPYYYPMPVTYGMAMAYNPYMGWSMGVSIHVGFGGFYGPPMYRPPYYPPHHPPYYGHGGGNNVIIKNGNINTGGNNIYNNQKGARPSTLPANSPGNSGREPLAQGRPSTEPAGDPGKGRPATTPANTSAGPRNDNVMADKNGNVYQRQGQNWQQNDGRNWQDTQQNTNDLDRQQMNRDRGTQRSNNFSQMNAGGMNRGGGGWGRRVR